MKHNVNTVLLINKLRLGNAEILFLTSQNEEFPMVLVKSMSCETLVISSDYQYGPKEILDNGDCGLMYPVGDIEKLKQYIETLLQNHAMRNLFIEKAYEKAKQYDVEKITKQYWEKVLE